MQQPPGLPAPPPDEGPRFPVEAPAGAAGAPALPKKKTSTAKIVLILLLVLVVVPGGSCATCMCLGLRRAQHAVEQNDADRRAAKSVPLNELTAAYRAGEAAADVTYKGTWIVVTGGLVDGVRKSAGDGLYVMVGTGKAMEIPEVQCLLRADQTEKEAALVKGQPVRVRGKVHGLLLNVVLESCEIL
jgi:hypothetical protein